MTFECNSDKELIPLRELHDAMLASSYMIFEVIQIVMPSDISELFDFDYGTTKNFLTRNPQFFEYVKEYPIIVRLKSYACRVGRSLLERYGRVLLRRVEQKFELLKRQITPLPSIRPKNEQLIILCRRFIPYWTKRLSELGYKDDEKVLNSQT